MDENKTGLMASNEASSPLLNQFREALSPAASKPMTFEQRLAGLSEAERTFILRTAKLVQLAMQMRKASNDRTMGWADLVKSMYGNLGITKRLLVAELLEEVAPLDFVPQPKAQLSSQEMARSLYDRPEYQLPEPSKADDDTAATLQAVLADTAQEPRKMKADFLERLTQNESSGDSNAEIIIADGRRYVGALQFGDARLQDYKKATGSLFTQDEFKADSALQDKVAAWHIADIDKTIDGLGLNTDGFDRDGLRAAAHLGGKHGMKKFVQSAGKYNPSDELGTSLQDYYDKFAVQS